MKYVILLGDGMADRPIEGLGGKTPLQAANTPNMNLIAKRGASGGLLTVPEGMKAGSDIANMSILGYDPKKYYTGRGPLEAANIGVGLGNRDLAFRCNLITERRGKLADYCAGHITTEEAAGLIGAVGEKYREVGEFHVGTSYRHLFVLRDCEDELVCTPPHDVLEGEIEEHLIKPRGNETAERLNRMMLDSKSILSRHPINKNRVKEGRNPGDMLWLWGQGNKPRLGTLEERFGIKGAMISAVDLLKGLARYAGMEVIEVPGATGYYDTNYEGKARSALEALGRNDLVYVHVESIDEAGHAGDVRMKIETLEAFDRLVVGKILDGLEGKYRISVLPDHATPIELKTHSPEPVPFSVCGIGIESDGTESFDEECAKRGSLGVLEGHRFVELLLGKGGSD